MFAVTWLLGPGNLYPLAHGGIKTHATVVALEPNNHWSVHYTYSVDGKQYSGVGHGGRGGAPSFEALAVGEPVVVSYDPERPSVSCLGNAELRYPEEVRGAFFGALWLGTWGSGVLLWRLAWRKRRASGVATLGETPPN
jgi:hypothetical protein